MSLVGRKLGLVFASLVWTLGCAEARAPREDASRFDGGGTSADAGVGSDAPRTDAARPDGGAAISGLAINEIRPSAGDFIELINTGTSGVDLGGVRIADDELGMPRLTRAFAFPEGIVLAAGERFVVVCEPATVMMGLVTGAACEIASVDRCIHTDWGISNAAGDTVYLVGSDDSVLAEGSYPGMASAGTAAGQSWCRLPDGVGDFAPCTATPAAPNAP